MSSDRRERGVFHVGAVTYLSTARAATMLGLHPSSVRRAAAAERTPAIRTPGGHRRVPAAWVRKLMEG